MKVFLSWSGERSHRVAKLLHEWLEIVIQAAEPWVSSSDIERGTQWSLELNKELEATTQGIFCLTADNKESSWILFEAGSLAKGQTTSRVYTLLIDITPAEVTGPLTLFNHTRPTEEDMFQLARSLNERLGERRLPDGKLRAAFDNAWPMFHSKFEKILKDIQPEGAPKDLRTEKEILGEVLELVRGFDKRIGKLENTSFTSAYVDRPVAVKEEYEQRRSINKIPQTPLIHYADNRPDYYTVGNEVTRLVLEGAIDADILAFLTNKPYSMTISQAEGVISAVRKLLLHATNFT